MTDERKAVLPLLQLPDLVLVKVLSYLSYEEIAHLRCVCQFMNTICQKLLNSGFYGVERYHAQCLKQVKSQLPRRESERRNHALARHCDVLTAIETRLSLLNMTFIKYVEMNLCCFIPGKVIDEIYRVLRFVKTTTTPPRTHETLQELRDISSMAMEHFDEKIVPRFKQNIVSTSLASKPYVPHGHSPYACSIPVSYSPAGDRVDCKWKVLSDEVVQKVKIIPQLKKDMKCLQAKLKIQSDKQRVCESQQEIINEYALKFQEQEAKLAEQENKIIEMNRRLMEYDQKFATLGEEMSNRRSKPAILSRRPKKGDNLSHQSCSKEDSSSTVYCLRKRKLEVTDPPAQKIPKA